MTFSDNLMVSVIAGVFGLIPALLQWVAALSQRRDRATRLEQLRGELEFLERWSQLKLRIQPAVVGETDRELQSALDRLLAEFHVLSRRGEPSLARADLSRTRRIFLLYTPPTRRAWRWHTVFYVLVVICVAMIVSDLLNPTYDPKTGQNEFGNLLLGMVVIFAYPFYRIHRAARDEARRFLSRPDSEPKEADRESRI